MDSIESLRIAVRSIRSHKLRSALTVLGVVIGIASVVAFATFGASVKADVLGDIGETSANNVYVYASPEGEGGFDVALQPLITTYDVDQIRELDGVERVLPRGPVVVSSISYHGDRISPTAVTATNPIAIANGSLSEGRAFRSGASEIVVNPAAARLFETNLSVNTTVNLTLASGETQDVRVVGIVEETEGELPVNDFGGEPRFYLPIDPFYQSMVESPSVGVRQQAFPQVTVITDPATLTAARAEIEGYLQESSDAAQLAPSGVELVAQTGGDFVEQIQSVIDQVTRFVTGIAVIALVVGAIGIANIMLVSVTERTKEIGIMKAMGARNRDVMQLFLLEASLLGLLGALVGLPLGIAVGYGATIYAETGFAIAMDWSLIAVAVGILVGVVSGLYPAYRAARVDPIDALRYE